MKKNAVYYIVISLILGFFAGAVSRPVLIPDGLTTMPEGYYWPTVLHQAEWGMVFGLTCGVVFTLYQNTWNKDRIRKKAWAGGIAIWMGMKFLWAGVAYTLAA